MRRIIAREQAHGDPKKCEGGQKFKSARFFHPDREFLPNEYFQLLI